MATLTTIPQNETRRIAFTARELAAMTGVTERRIYYAMTKGEIETVRLFGRLLIPAEAVERLLNPQTEGGTHDR